MAARPPAGAEFEAPLGDVIKHRGPLGNTDGVLFGRGQAGDPGGEVDALGLGCHVAHNRCRRGHVAVLHQAVVLTEPGVLPVVPVSGDGVLSFSHQGGVLCLAVMSRRPWDVAVEKNAELHVCPPW